MSALDGITHTSQILTVERLQIAFLAEAVAAEHLEAKLYPDNGLPYLA
jgi:hypothetical protein